MTNDRAPGADDIEILANDTYAALPAFLRAPIEAVVIRVEEFPSEETIAEMELETPYDLLGLYQGVSLDRQSLFDVRDDIDMIFLYRQPLLAFWIESGETLADVVKNVLIHEIGHHFGFSDEDMERIEQAE